MRVLILRRAAQRSVLTGCPEAVIALGSPHVYAADSPPGRVLATARASRHRIDARILRLWAAGSPERARSIKVHGMHSMPVAPLRARGITLGVITLARQPNAIRYASGPIRLRLIKDEALICEVSDCSSTSPHLRRARAFDEGGRGLFLVAKLTHDGALATPPPARPSGPNCPSPPRLATCSPRSEERHSSLCRGR